MTGDAPRRARTARSSVANILLRIVAAAALYAGLLFLAVWLGQVVAAPGDWLATDLALFRALNGVAIPGLTALLFTTLNDPGIVYFALILVLLAYCGRRRRALLPLVAVGLGLALGLNQVATRGIHAAGHRARPYTQVAEARTPIQSCGGLGLVAMRGGDGPQASCQPGEAAIQGIDWREIWDQFPSFPSGHMRESLAISTLIAYAWPASLPALALWNVTLGFSRVHLGAHYPSDVLLGAVVGIWSGGVVLLGIDALRRLLVSLRDVPVIGRAWEWVYITRVRDQPQLDPLAARLIRIGVFAVGLHVALYALGFASNSPRASHLFNTLQDVDGRAYLTLTGRFEPALAPGLYASLGPGGFLYALLVAITLVVGLVRSWRLVVPAALTLVVAGLLAQELSWAGHLMFQRPPPFVQHPDAPVPAEWRALWAAASSFPSTHALMSAALAGVLASTWRPLAVPAQVLALAAAATAMYFGAAWLSDALTGFVAGNAVAMLAGYAVAQFYPARFYPARRAERLRPVRPDDPLPMPAPAGADQQPRAS